VLWSRADSSSPSSLRSLRERRSAAHLGYVDDPFVEFFVHKPPSRSPLINRGHFARVTAVTQHIEQFVAVTGGRGQVLSLGAAYDTTYFRLKRARRAPWRYFEVDFAAIGARKAALIRKHPQLAELTGPFVGAEDAYGGFAGRSPSSPLAGAHREDNSRPNAGSALPASPSAASGISGTSSSASSTAASAPAAAAAAAAGPAAAQSGHVCTKLRSPRNDVSAPARSHAGDFAFADYAFVSGDLRDVATLERKLVAAGLDLSRPTLVLAECVLVYLRPQDSAPVIRWAAERLGPAGVVFVALEHIRPRDPFGTTMVRNLQARGCALLSIDAFPEPADQVRRFREAGFASATCWDMNQIYAHFLAPAEVARIERLELFDEFEEWFLMQAHYGLVVAALQKGGSQPAADLNKLGILGLALPDASNKINSPRAVHLPSPRGSQPPSGAPSAGAK
jgi:O-methyltransferase involved in polyketide biosynthesis